MRSSTFRLDGPLPPHWCAVQLGPGRCPWRCPSMPRSPSTSSTRRHPSMPVRLARSRPATGADTTASFTGAPSGGPLSGALTQTGDGIGVHFQASGSSANGDSTAGYLFADYTFDLANSSATETFTLVFKALFGAAGNKTDASGVDAFAESLLSVFDTSNVEVIYPTSFPTRSIPAITSQPQAAATSTPCRWRRAKRQASRHSRKCVVAHSFGGLRCGSGRIPAA